MKGCELFNPLGRLSNPTFQLFTLTRIVLLIWTLIEYVGAEYSHYFQTVFEAGTMQKVEALPVLNLG